MIDKTVRWLKVMVKKANTSSGRLVRIQCTYIRKYVLVNVRMHCTLACTYI